MKKLLLITTILTLLSCNKETDKPVIFITPSLASVNGKWVVQLDYSDTINTSGFVRFYWVVSDSNKKQYKYFGALPLEKPEIHQIYASQIPAFSPYTIDSQIVEPSDYLNKYTILIKQ